MKRTIVPYLSILFGGLLTVSTLANNKNIIPFFDSDYSALIGYLKPIIAAKNLGAGNGIYQSKTGRTLNFITLTAGPHIGLTATSNTITIATAGDAYAYISNIGAQTVNFGTNVTFSVAGTVSGVTHTAGSATITITNAGTYAIEYGLTTAVGSASVPFQLLLDGNPVAGTIGVSIVNPTQITGQATVAITAGQVVTLRNISGTTEAFLTAGGGSDVNNTNAYVLIRQLA